MQQMFYCFLVLLSFTHLRAYSTHTFLLVDATKQQTLISEGNIDEPIGPFSTFKIPIALMGFENQILKDDENPLWKYEAEKHSKDFIISAHKQDLTPKKWMTVSAVWYSREITNKLGNSKFDEYVKLLKYGNMDTSGDPGKNNGLTHSWLGSSLKITTREQVAFLTALMQQKLPFKTQAQVATAQLISLPDEQVNGRKLFGKTGSGDELNADGTKNPNLMRGWFVGWLENDAQRLVFAYLIKNVEVQKGISGGKAAKKEALKKLRFLLK